MTTLRVVAVLVIALLGTMAGASQPCSAPQITMQPATGSTAVEGPLQLSADQANPLELARMIQVTAADGGPSGATIKVSSGSYGAHAEIDGLSQPGWYIVRIAGDGTPRESLDRSLVPDGDAFVGEVLVGGSAPSVRLVEQCPTTSATSVIVSWSEPVLFPVDPASAITLRSNGQVLTCVDNAYASPWDGGAEQSESLTCNGTAAVTSIELVTPPHGLDGSVAAFPSPGTDWTMTGWVSDEGCTAWEPSVRQRGHENLTASGWGPSYDKCPWNQGGCSASAPTLLGGLGAWLLLLLLRRRRTG